ncbi:MAG: CpsD/CapB family tyrosine-protein kinase [Armatimonadetes bacterium]|nr:CpsD/CapB family tyrosine-protein kinase [Armatimonadota bacterium]
MSPADIVSGSRMREVLAELTAQADCIMIDSPPVSMFAEGMQLSGLVDGVILVINPRRWRGEQEREVKKTLEEAGAKILGLVINGVDDEDDEPYGYYGYYRYYNQGSKTAPPKKSLWNWGLGSRPK